MERVKNKEKEELREEIQKCKDCFEEGKSLLEILREILKKRNGKFQKVGQSD